MRRECEDEEGEGEGDAEDAHGDGAEPAMAALLASVSDCVETTGDAVCAG